MLQRDILGSQRQGLFAITKPITMLVEPPHLCLQAADHLQSANTPLLLVLHLPLPDWWLQNNFSLPELQCFISDSQLTRDAALHLRLGDRALHCSAWVASGGHSSLDRRRGIREDLSSTPPALPRDFWSYPSIVSCPWPAMGTLWDQISAFLFFSLWTRD